MISQPSATCSASSDLDCDVGERLVQRYQRVRSLTMDLMEPLSAEDAGAQSMTCCSPAKWHLAHTSWFFEQMILDRFVPGRVRMSDAASMYNSYYTTMGKPFERSKRGLLTRPALDEVVAHRESIDREMETLLGGVCFTADDGATLLELVEIGLSHEEQHQELLLSDIKHLFSQSPLSPAYAVSESVVSARTPSTARDQSGMMSGSSVDPWNYYEGGLVEIGAAAGAFAYDNETPAHREYLAPYRIAKALVTNADWLAFIEDGGYERSELWLDAGWKTAGELEWIAPLYWRRRGSAWSVFTLEGEAPINPEAPVAHVSFFEAEAFARWKRCRLPTEQEWENAVRVGRLGVTGSGLSAALALSPGTAGSENSLRSNDDGLVQVFGSLWQWTRSDYGPYPGFSCAEGAIGEYNGKFMSGQYVLRGSSFATPEGHARVSYRNYYKPADRWCFAGVRLAQEAE